MPSRLISCAAIMLGLSLIFSVLTNFQSEPSAQAQRQLSFESFKNHQQIDWQNILLTLPQYKKPERALTAQELAAQEALQKTSARPLTISDAYLIGIIVDKPKAVLLFVPQQDSLDPIQLGLGESWLADWQLSQINPDSAVWLNTQTQQSYTQLLFSSANQTIDSLNTPSSEIN